MEHAALKGRAVCFSRDILLQILQATEPIIFGVVKKC